MFTTIFMLLIFLAFITNYFWNTGFCFFSTPISFVKSTAKKVKVFYFWEGLYWSSGSVFFLSILFFLFGASIFFLFPEYLSLYYKFFSSLVFSVMIAKSSSFIFIMTYFLFSTILFFLMACFVSSLSLLFKSIKKTKDFIFEECVVFSYPKDKKTGVIMGGFVISFFLSLVFLSFISLVTFAFIKIFMSLFTFICGIFKYVSGLTLLSYSDFKEMGWLGTLAWFTSFLVLSSNKALNCLGLSEWIPMDPEILMQKEMEMESLSKEIEDLKLKSEKSYLIKKYLIMTGGVVVSVTIFVVCPVVYVYLYGLPGSVANFVADRIFADIVVPNCPDWLSPYATPVMFWVWDYTVSDE